MRYNPLPHAPHLSQPAVDTDGLNERLPPGIDGRDGFYTAKLLRR